MDKELPHNSANKMEVVTKHSQEQVLAVLFCLLIGAMSVLWVASVTQGIASQLDQSIVLCLAGTVSLLITCGFVRPRVIEWFNLIVFCLVCLGGPLLLFAALVGEWMGWL